MSVLRAKSVLSTMLQRERNLFRTPLLLLTLGLGINASVSGQESPALTETIVWIESGVQNTSASFEFYSPVSRKLRIVDLDASRVLYVDESGTGTSERNSGEVVALEIDWPSDESREAMRLFAQHEFRNALPKLQKAIKSGVLQWHQRIIVAAIVDSLLALGQYEQAAKVYISLAAQNPPPMLAASIPLAWTGSDNNRAMQRASAAWMSADDETSRLLGASWALSGKEREPAIALLRNLAKSAGDKTIRDLAECQLWRIVPANEAIAGPITEWQNKRDALIGPLEWGPTLTIADKFDRGGKKESAIAQWMRVVTNHRRRYAAAKFSIESAVETVRQTGRDDLADKMQSEYSDLLTDLKNGS